MNSSNEVSPFSPEVNLVLEPIAPAGDINSNTEDLANWLIFQLNEGSFNGIQLVSPESLEETHSACISTFPPGVLPRPIFPAGFISDTYGLGWFIGSYRGHVMLFHGGNTIGHSSMMILFPYDDIGISVLTNMNELETPQLVIAWTAFDLLMGYEPWLNSSNICNFPCAWKHCNTQTKRKHGVHSEHLYTTEVPDEYRYVGHYH
jgi:CubicO group peptidase (beta-lactamase class C family)